MENTEDKQKTQEKKLKPEDTNKKMNQKNTTAIVTIKKPSWNHWINIQFKIRTKNKLNREV